MFEREGVHPAEAPGGSPWWDRHEEETAFIAALNAELVAEGYVEGDGWGDGGGWDEGWGEGDGAAGEGEPFDAFRRPDGDALAAMVAGRVWRSPSRRRTSARSRRTPWWRSSLRGSA